MQPFIACVSEQLDPQFAASRRITLGPHPIYRKCTAYPVSGRVLAVAIH